ncbi:MAG: nucleoside 2-deoxyribosyltransferase [Methanomicrobiales archaeon]|nr:nucleoside 2-deoxyribosyltransferase [Methanomicrobiales archaeon]
MKVYLAHNYAAKEMLRTVKQQLEVAGITVTSRWIDANPDNPYDPKVMQDEAVKDVEDVLSADALVHFSDNYGDRPGRGKYVEFGIAIPSGKRILLVGREHSGCVFYHLPRVEHYPAETTTNDLIKALLS